MGAKNCKINSRANGELALDIGFGVLRAARIAAVSRVNQHDAFSSGRNCENGIALADVHEMNLNVAADRLAPAQDWAE